MVAGRLAAPPGRGRTTLVLWLAGLPPVLVTAVVLFFSISELAGGTPFSIGPPANVAEAAGLGSGAEVLRMLQEGQDPRAVLEIRPEIISSTVRRASALEAAVWSRTSQLLDLFDRQGALSDQALRRELACLAADLSADEVVEYLSPKEKPECVEGATLAKVLERTPRS